VVLLALLAPALDRAIYQAELAMCGVNQRTVASGMILYAFDHSRSYPYRYGLRTLEREGGPYSWRPTYLKHGFSGNIVDERPLYRNYMKINDVFNDPLAVAVDLENDVANGEVLATTGVWAGWAYRWDRASPQMRGLFRLGDRFVWDRLEFDVLASDIDVTFRTTRDEYQSSHPDHRGVLAPLAVENAPHPWWDHDYPGTGSAIPITISLWINFANRQRGPDDLNFAYQDGSVRLLTDVIWNEPDRQGARTAWVPGWGNRNQNSDEVLQLPIR
jgi:hypothetical protein